MLIFKVKKVYNGDYDDEIVLGTYPNAAEAHSRIMEEWDNEPSINHEHIEIYVEQEEIK